MENTEDPLEGLEERLQNHSKAFESLLALTPARQYFGSQVDDGLDPSEQWSRKKQTKEQKKAAKLAKLDPANQKTALDVMKEREKKRKRELGMDDEEDIDGDKQKVETANGQPSNAKKQKKALDPEAAAAKRIAIADKRKEKREKKKAKMTAKKDSKSAKKAAKQDTDLAEASAERAAEAGAEASEDDDDEEDAEPMAHPTDMDGLEVSGLGDSDEEDNTQDDEDDAAEASSAPTSPKSSTTSKADLKIALPAIPKQLSLPTNKPTDLTSGTSSPKIQLPNIDQAELQERLRKRIEELRARRKADGDGSKPAKSRQELLEQRRKKEEQRKAHKKDLRRQQKEEEAQKREAQLRGSAASPDVFSRNSPRPATSDNNSFSFSRLAFEDGTAADASLTDLHDPRKKKGPQDPRTALAAAEKKAARLSSLDPAKRADIAEKDMWLNAKKRAHGERVRDDASLLKKALKRQEKGKNKSEKEWKEREHAVVHGKEMKQKKREGNLAKRREEKGGKGKKKNGGAAPPKGGGGGGSKAKKRAGFEGRFKA
ncbi:unnamed protein product [Zymoseptoria tritici ST99CH_3D7]|uniref:Ribosomal RNA-processing protein 14/surfeit locus protein 6 C-terminal domain-containing protein n=1 Tax=Zymoseptoria tritici (strain ST99CH_3D7) TaxID=1276538 RepID=A0A1X7RY05_ZYMT9|nr:unnamed protein product [Zymoseptoria tritici ST99CH_3D7]